MENEKVDKSQRDLVIKISGLKKRYRLGRIGAGTLQGTIKEWRERRRNPDYHVLRKSRNPFFYALKGINLEVHRGETIGIIGRNGAGKSTFLKILSRITAPTEGSVDLYGRITSMLEVGTGFHGDMTGRENIYLNGAILGMTKAEIDAKMDDIIRFSELEEFIDTPIKKYSSGMYVKLGFSVAYHLDSEIIIMDEVLAVGDVAFQRKCLNCLLEAAKQGNRTILYVSHNLSSVRRLCNRCVVLDKGMIVYDGNVDKAIPIYLGLDSSMPTKIVFNKDHRNSFCEHCFSFTSLELVNRSEAIFTDMDEAVFTLACVSTCHIKNVGIRIEFCYQDEVKVATSFSTRLFDVPTGASRILLRLPIRHLAPGQYRLGLVAYVYEASPKEKIIDSVCPGFTLQIEPDVNRANYLEWDYKQWGAIRLEDLIVERVESLT